MLVIHARMSMVDGRKRCGSGRVGREAHLPFAFVVSGSYIQRQCLSLVVDALYGCTELIGRDCQGPRRIRHYGEVDWAMVETKGVVVRILVKWYFDFDNLRNIGDEGQRAGGRRISG